MQLISALEPISMEISNKMASAETTLANITDYNNTGLNGDMTKENLALNGNTAESPNQEETAVTDDIDNNVDNIDTKGIIDLLKRVTDQNTNDVQGDTETDDQVKVTDDNNPASPSDLKTFDHSVKSNETSESLNGEKNEKNKNIAPGDDQNIPKDLNKVNGDSSSNVDGSIEVDKDEKASNVLNDIADRVGGVHEFAGDENVSDDLTVVNCTSSDNVDDSIAISNDTNVSNDLKFNIDTSGSVDGSIEVADDQNMCDDIIEKIDESLNSCITSQIAATPSSESTDNNLGGEVSEISKRTLIQNELIDVDDERPSKKIKLEEFSEENANENMHSNNIESASKEKTQDKNECSVTDIQTCDTVTGDPTIKCESISEESNLNVSNTELSNEIIDIKEENLEDVSTKPSENCISGDTEPGDPKIKSESISDESNLNVSNTEMSKEIIDIKDEPTKPSENGISNKTNENCVKKECEASSSFIVDSDNSNSSKTDEQTAQLVSNNINKEAIKEVENVSIMDIDSDIDIVPMENERSQAVVAVTEKVTEVIATSDLGNQSNTEKLSKDVVNLIDDDDVMLVEENKNEGSKKAETEADCNSTILKPPNIANDESATTVEVSKENEKVTVVTEPTDQPTPDIQTAKPLLSNNFVKQFKSKLNNMTREDLEEFCILKMVEGIVERSGLADISTRMHTLEQQADHWRKKALVLAKQNKDLQIVLKTVQEEHKARLKEIVQPLKITRSVGLQVLMLDNHKQLQSVKGKIRVSQSPNSTPQSQQKQWEYSRTPSKVINHKPKPPAQTIPVPRLVPAVSNSPAKVVRTPEPVTDQKMPEKRLRGCIDLTDDEPVQKKLSIAPMAVVQANKTVRAKISTPPSPRPTQVNQVVRPGQTMIFRTLGPQGIPMRPAMQLRAALTQIPRSPAIRPARHPAPLPATPKHHIFGQKPLPPAPELKITKVENGIVISWIMEGYNSTKYEEIASYQLYAYQETSAPPNTLLWKKIGDVKALPLPMACTLTQFMAGYKYYFAVRAVDIRSRLGPFSLPGSILLLQK